MNISFGLLSGWPRKKRSKSQDQNDLWSYKPLDYWQLENKHFLLTANKQPAACVFTLKELQEATCNFCDGNLIGEGGFGHVYRGVLKTGKVVAIKLMDLNLLRGVQGEKEFRVEVDILSRLGHPNLVHLIGYCADRRKRLLVYEFMHNGNLQEHLHGILRTKMNWPLRLKIALGAARGLAYLHSGPTTGNPIIHRDFKSTNILLDATFEPRVREKRAELEKLKTTFVRRASEFLRNYFASLVDFMISDKTYFSQRGQLKRPDHADLRYKCRTYARLLQHLKSLDKSCLGSLRKAYCHSLNLLLRREAREFANELRASTKASRNPTVWLEGSVASSQAGSSADTSTVSEAYAKMLTIFIPLLVDESSFFALFMCFEVLPLVPPGAPAAGADKEVSNSDDDNEDDLSLMDLDGNDVKPNQNTAELEALNEALQELLDGIQDDFYAVVDWAYKIDPLRCISMHGITERYLSGQKADAAGFVRRLLDDLQTRITMQFNRFVDEACHQIERNDRNVRQVGVLSYIPRFATLATRMEQYIQGQSRELVDQAYTKFVGTMFTTLERIAQIDPKHADIVLLENYAAFQNSLYDLANVVPTLAKFYHQASEAYEQACTRYINSIINYQFEKLFQFAQKVENLMYTITPEEVPFQLGLSKMDLRKMLKSSLSGVEKSLQTMYKRMQKNLTSEELVPSLWDKCKADFLDKYESFEVLLAKCYPNETLSPSAAEMKELFKTI